MSEPRIPGQPTGDQPTGGRRGSDEHLGLDALAECLAAEPRSTSAAGRHLAGCAGCSDRLAELREAEPAVSAALRSLPSLPLPDDVAARLDAALRDLGADVAVREPTLARTPSTATVTTLPTPAAAAGRSPMRWLTAAAASLVLLVGGGLGISALSGSDAGSTTAGGAGSALGLVRNDTGADYADRDALVAAVPSLLDGSAASGAAALSAPVPAQAAPKADDQAQSDGTAGSAADPGAPAPEAMTNREAGDPLARLRTDAGLADCLVALLPPDEPDVAPLALDYGSYAGTPAMVVLLPGAVSGKVDVFVVGPGCSQANDSTLFYTSVASS